MESLYNADVGFNETWLRSQGFDVTVPDANDFKNWTSTTVSYTPDQVWIFDFYTGLVSPNTTLPWVDNSTGVSYPTTLSFWPVRATSAGPAPVAKTGQTTSTAAGDDGQLQAGMAWPSPRFMAGGDCITDNLTGLMWAKSANLPGEPLSWEDALAFVEELNGTLCGQTGWRLPNRKEMRSLANYGTTFDSWLTGQGFTNIQSGYGEWTPGSWWVARYWTSTTILGGGWGVPVMADAVGSYAGELNYDLKYDRLQFVWPVRTASVSDPAPDAYRLTIARAGKGTGSVTSSPAGIACGTDCTESYSSGTVVTLIATPANRSLFTGWSGHADCADGVVTLDAGKKCTANFKKVWRR
jgi:hypothetical protein